MYRYSHHKIKQGVLAKVINNSIKETESKTVCMASLFLQLSFSRPTQNEKLVSQTYYALYFSYK